MSMTNLNANVGIDLGSNASKLANDNKIIAAIDGSDLLTLREESEVYFDEPVFSCVVAVPDSMTKRAREDLIFKAKKAGFKNINVISAREAMIKALENKNKEKILVYDFGASKSEIIIFRGDEVLDAEIINDVSGDEFDKIFAQWLSERFTLNLIDKNTLLARAMRIKIALSTTDFVTWRDISITRDDFERLVRFSIKRASHTVERFLECYKPSRFILTGGCSEIPIVRRVFRDLYSNLELDLGLIARGASIDARLLSSVQQSQKLDRQLKLREIRSELMELEDFLTRKQKDRIYFLFRQAEGLLTNDPALIKLLENLTKEIKKEESGIKN
ncbi:MAG: Hsp70 family protein [Synergistaceae bacterium]|nr:Hsp70 family protein [Synergistaceae bacterium]